MYGDLLPSTTDDKEDQATRVLLHVLAQELCMTSGTLKHALVENSGKC